MGSQHPPQWSREQGWLFSGCRLSLRFFMLSLSCHPVLSLLKSLLVLHTTVQPLHKSDEEEIIHMMRRGTPERHFILSKWAPSLFCQESITCSQLVCNFLTFLLLILRIYTFKKKIMLWILFVNHTSILFVNHTSIKLGKIKQVNRGWCGWWKQL